MAFQVEFDYGSGWNDVTNYVVAPSLKRTFHAHKNLKSTINTCTFDMMYSTTIVNALYGSSNVEVRIHDNDSNDWFTGYVKDQMSTVARSRGKTFSVECVDHAWDLKKPISRETANNFPLISPYIYKSTDTDNSILYQLLVADGPLSSLASLPDITDTVDHIDIVDGEQTYEQVLKDLLFEFGYSYYFDESGDMKVLDLFPSSLSPTATFSTAARNIKTELKIERSTEQHDAVRVSFNKLYTFKDSVVYRETEYESEDYPGVSYGCKIELLSAEHYPSAAGDGDAFLQYDVPTNAKKALRNPDSELITVTNAYAWYQCFGNVQLTKHEFTNFGKEALVDYENASGATAYLLRFEIRGDAIVLRGVYDREYSPGGSPEDRKVYKAKYIQTDEVADRLAVGWCNWYQYGDFLYTFTSDADVDVGAIVTLNETAVTGVNITGRVVARVDRPYNGVADYTIEGMVAYSAQTPDVETKIFPVNVLSTYTSTEFMDFETTDIGTRALRVSEIAPFEFDWLDGGDSDDSMSDAADGGASGSDSFGKSFDAKLGSYAYDDMGEGTIQVKANMLVTGDIDIQGDEAIIGDYDGGNGIKWDGTNLTVNGGGTFTGTLSGADGTFSGSLSAVDGTFTGNLNAANIGGNVVRGYEFSTSDTYDDVYDTLVSDFDSGLQYMTFSVMGRYGNKTIMFMYWDYTMSTIGFYGTGTQSDSINFLGGSGPTGVLTVGNGNATNLTADLKITTISYVG